MQLFLNIKVWNMEENDDNFSVVVLCKLKVNICHKHKHRYPFLFGLGIVICSLWSLQTISDSFSILV